MVKLDVPTWVVLSYDNKTVKDLESWDVFHLREWEKVIDEKLTPEWTKLWEYTWNKLIEVIANDVRLLLTPEEYIDWERS